MIGTKKGVVLVFPIKMSASIIWHCPANAVANFSAEFVAWEYWDGPAGGRAVREDDVPGRLAEEIGHAVERAIHRLLARKDWGRRQWREPLNKLMTLSEKTSKLSD